MGKSHNDVRQVLMNEMGLTRESVREEVVAVVRETVASFLNSSRFEKTFSGVIVKVLNEHLKAQQYDRDMLKRAVSEAVTRELMSRLTIQVAVNGAKP